MKWLETKAAGHSPAFSELEYAFATLLPIWDGEFVRTYLPNLMGILDIIRIGVWEPDTRLEKQNSITLSRRSCPVA